MTLWWIGSIVLLLVVLPVVVYLLRGVLEAARSIVPSVQGIATVAAAGSRDLDAAALLLTTQSQVEQTVEGLADYGGSLDVILDDAEPEQP
jgi:nitric oxide reductase large subunit